MSNPKQDSLPICRICGDPIEEGAVMIASALAGGPTGEYDYGWIHLSHFQNSNPMSFPDYRM